MINNFKAGAAAFAGAVLGGLVVWLTQGHTLRVVPDQMSYADLAAVLLAVAALFLGAIGLIVAIVAIWGFKYFKQVAVSSARRAAHEKVASELKAGDAKALVIEEARRVAQQRIEEEIRDGSTRRYLDSKVNDAIAKALSENALIGGELAAKRNDEAEKFRDLDQQEGE